MWESEKQLSTHDARAVQGRVFLQEPGVAVGALEPASLVGESHLLARLVHQGSEPTLPYQALVTRESAKLCLRFAFWCQIGVLGA
jgi:hypothetical protein